MGKNYKFGVATIAASLFLIGCSTDSITESFSGDDDEQFSRSTLYLKDSSGAGVAGIPYSCNGGHADGNQLDTSGNTSSAGDMSVSYWPGYDVICTITPSGAPKLYLYDGNGPVTNPTQVDCTKFHGFIGDDGVAGSINNASSDTCRLRLLEVTIN